MRCVLLPKATLLFALLSHLGASASLAAQPQSTVPAQPTPLPASEVTAAFNRSAPDYLRTLLRLPTANLVQSYFSIAYKITTIHQFAQQGARMVVGLGNTLQTITKDNADAYVKGYSDVLAMHGQAIRQRGFRQVGGAFTMTVGPRCQGSGFRDGGAVSITQSDYNIKLVNGWPDHFDEFKGVVIGDTIFIGGPAMPEVIFTGKIEAGRVELNFDACKLTLTPS